MRSLSSAAGYVATRGQPNKCDSLRSAGDVILAGDARQQSVTDWRVSRAHRRWTRRGGVHPPRRDVRARGIVTPAGFTPSGGYFWAFTPSTHPMSTSDLIARGGWNHPQLIQLCGFCCVDVFLSAGNSVLGPALGSHCLEPQRVSHARSIGLPHDLFRACRQWQSWCAMISGHHLQGCVAYLNYYGKDIR